VGKEFGNVLHLNTIRVTPGDRDTRTATGVADKATVLPTAFQYARGRHRRPALLSPATARSDYTCQPRPVAPQGHQGGHRQGRLRKVAALRLRVHIALLGPTARPVKWGRTGRHLLLEGRPRPARRDSLGKCVSPTPTPAHGASALRPPIVPEFGRLVASSSSLTNRRMRPLNQYGNLFNRRQHATTGGGRGAGVCDSPHRRGLTADWRSRGGLPGDETIPHAADGHPGTSKTTYGAMRDGAPSSRPTCVGRRLRSTHRKSSHRVRSS